MRRLHMLRWTAAVAVVLGIVPLRAQDVEADDDDHKPAVTKGKTASMPSNSNDDKKFRDFNEVVKGAQKHEGFFNLHLKDDHLYAEIGHQQYDQPFLMPIAIAKGLAMAGQPLNFGDEWVLMFHRAGDKVQLIRKNTHYKSPSDASLEKAVKQNYTDSILMALPIISTNAMNGQGVLVDFSDIFLGDFAQLNFGFLDRNRTSYHKIKAFPNNVEIEVEATFGGFGAGRNIFGGMDDGVIDSRGRTLVIHYSLAKLPDSSYRVRHADDRVGHFLNSTEDFGSHDVDTTRVRMINRWRLEKSDPKAKLSPPKKQIIWYVEDTVPHEYRPYVEEGIREWNKAFEKIGFRDAISVRWQEPGRDDFDPEDINYCTFRWITTNMTYAMSCLRSNPLTGEMIDGDVIFDASWIRAWKEQYAFLTGSVIPTGREGSTSLTGEPLSVGRILSPIMASKEGFGLPFPLAKARGSLLAETTRTGTPRAELVPSEWNELHARLRRRQSAGRLTACTFTYGMRPELGLAAMALAADDKDKDKDKKDEKKEPEAKLPEEMMGQLIKEVVMHEVGHSLGLRHNFKASTMLTADQLNDTAITRVKGMAGSVMDYNPINIAPKGQKQGDYTTTTIGPYDYWAIEYAYKPVDGDEAAELKKIASRSPEAELVFATDEDMMLNDDPLVNTYDLGSDTLRFAKDRIALATDLLKDLDSKVIKDGDAFTRVREAFGILLNQWGNGAYLVASNIGGQSVSRDHKGKASRDPVVPVAAAKQREALTFLVDQILSDKAFKFSPTLLRRLGSDKWYDGSGFFYGGGIDYPLNEELLGIQKIVLSRCLSPDVLARLANQELQVDAGADALRPSEVFRALTNGIWSDVSTNAASGATKDKPFALSTIRRNLQREYLRRLSTIVLGDRRSPYNDMFAFVIFRGGQSYPADARSLARLHLKEIKAKIGTLQGELPIDDTTKAHLEECAFRIGKVLDAGIESNEP